MNGMSFKHWKITVPITALALTLSSPAFANDREATMGRGGFDVAQRRGTGAHYRDTYFTDTDFLASFDRIEAAWRKANPERIAYTEKWFSYVLKSGANWRSAD